MSCVADRGLADRVDGDESGDGDAVVEACRSRAEAALQIGGRGPGAGADRAEAEARPGSGEGSAAEPAIGTVAAPALVAAIIEVEEDRRRHDRHAGIADGKTAARL